MGHIIVFYDRAGWSSLQQRRDTHWYLFIYKALVGKSLNYLSDLLCHSDSLYQTCSSDWLMLHVPRVRSELGKTVSNFSVPD